MNPSTIVPVGEEAHARAAEAFATRLRGPGGDGPVALAKASSNLFRPRTSQARGVRPEGLDGVVSIDPDARLARVQGMCTFETFVDAVLPLGLRPPVVPELKTITLGGALVGIGIESSSFRFGFVHESVEEVEVLRGDGSIVVCRPGGENDDLFRALPNSYGTLGYVLRATVRLEPAPSRVRLTHRRFSDEAALLAALERACTHDHPDPPDFVEAVAFSPTDLVLSEGRLCEDPGPVSRWGIGSSPYYLSLREREGDLLATRDYLWRWDDDWFWCSRAFGLQNPLLRTLLGHRLLGSRRLWKILTGWRRYGLEARIHAVRRALGLPVDLREPVIQDVEIPLGRCGEFLAFYRENLDIRPLWLCPVRSIPDRGPWTLYPMTPGLHVNFGFWESVPTRADLPRGHFNRLLEREVEQLGGRKSLYSESFYPEDEFWSIFDRESYLALKARHDPAGRLRDLWRKAVRGA